MSIFNKLKAFIEKDWFPEPIQPPPQPPQPEPIPLPAVIPPIEAAPIDVVTTEAATPTPTPDQPPAIKAAKAPKAASLEARQAELKARLTTEAVEAKVQSAARRAERTYDNYTTVSRAARAVLEDPNATPGQKLKAAKLLERRREEGKKLRSKAKAENAAEDAAATKDKYAGGDWSFLTETDTRQSAIVVPKARRD